MNFSDLEDAFLFVGGAAPFERTAMICTQTDQVCFRSELSGFDEIPEEAYDSDSWREIPHKNTLGLGRDLVFLFMAKHLPSDQDHVLSIFSRSGAYSMFKGFLEEKGILEKWYEFENSHQKETILEWCRTEGIEITE